MRLFSVLYAKVLSWSAHPKAVYYLMGLSFAEASFFPIPPDALLMPMALAKRANAWRYAATATLFSTIGGIFGYLIGMFFWVLIKPLMIHVGYLDQYHQVKLWFHHWGFLALIIAGFTPIPYKIFTIAAGTLHMSILPFVLASLIGRGGRFFLVAGLIVAGGDKLPSVLEKYIDWIGWGTLLLIGVLYLLLR